MDEQQVINCVTSIQRKELLVARTPRSARVTPASLGKVVVFCLQ